MKKLIAVLLTSVMLFACAVGMSGCRIFETKADKYTVEEHLERIAKKVDARYMSGDYDFTSYELYPIYNQDEQLNFVLVEFEPQGFVTVQIQKGYLGQMKYRRYERRLDIGWYKYRYVDLQEGQVWSDVEDDVWKVVPGQQGLRVTLHEYDEDGKEIIYYVSPYKLAGVLDKRLYLINNAIAAVKTENGYLNLVSMQEFVYFEGIDGDDEPTFDVSVLPYDEYNL
jgi:hypothetical protein